MQKPKTDREQILDKLKDIVRKSRDSGNAIKKEEYAYKEVVKLTQTLTPLARKAAQQMSMMVNLNTVDMNAKLLTLAIEAVNQETIEENELMRVNAQKGL